MMAGVKLPSKQEVRIEGIKAVGCHDGSYASSISGIPHSEQQEQWPTVLPHSKGGKGTQQSSLPTTKSILVFTTL